MLTTMAATAAASACAASSASGAKAGWLKRRRRGRSWSDACILHYMQAQHASDTFCTGYNSVSFFQQGTQRVLLFVGHVAAICAVAAGLIRPSHQPRGRAPHIRALCGFLHSPKSALWARSRRSLQGMGEHHIVVLSVSALDQRRNAYRSNSRTRLTLTKYCRRAAGWSQRAQRMAALLLGVAAPRCNRWFTGLELSRC